MTLTRKFFSFLYTAIIMAFHCDAGGYPPPTHLTYKWLDSFTVNVSWKKPSLSDGREVTYLMTKAFQMKSASDELRKCTPYPNVTVNYLTEETGSDGVTYYIWTVDKNCNHSSDSTPASVTIHTRKPRAEVVRDFKCLLYRDKMNCSWNPVNQSLDVTVYYRICGDPEEHIKSLKKCDQPYRSGKKNGCSLQVNTDREDICILVDTEAGMSTFKAEIAVPPPKLSIKEERDRLKLNWTPPEVGERCDWTYKVCYKQCNKKEVCLSRRNTMMVVESYDKSCLYEFRSKVETSAICPKLFNDFSEVVTYGTNEPPDRTLTVVAIVIPIILSVCVILSCYCFRRHSAIICPIIPDPSAIFKEMMMNGNKELKTPTGSLYTPVPEPIEPCKITLVTENSVLQQNS